MPEFKLQRVNYLFDIINKYKRESHPDVIGLDSF